MDFRRGWLVFFPHPYKVGPEPIVINRVMGPL